jgi:hypothetical protein
MALSRKTSRLNDQRCNATHGALEQETIMTKIIILMALAFALAAGSVMFTVHPQRATARKPAGVHGSTSVFMFEADPWQGTVPFSI